jgi:hypothetical protein
MRVLSLACVAFVATSVAIPSTVGAGEVTAPQNCFDAEVYATVTQEVPSDIPMNDNDTIVMEWPWFLDLQVERVVHGSLRPGALTVLSVQHTYFKPHYALWWLRRNSTGGFNVLRGDDTERLDVCPTDAAPVEPYVYPGEGQTMDDLRRAGERRYGHFPSD